MITLAAVVSSSDANPIEWFLLCLFSYPVAFDSRGVACRARSEAWENMGIAANLGLYHCDALTVNCQHIDPLPMNLQESELLQHGDIFNVDRIKLIAHAKLARSTFSAVAVF